MILENISSKQAMFLGFDTLYSFNNIVGVKSDRKGNNKVELDFIKDDLQDAVLQYAKDTLVYVKSNHIKTIYLPTKKALLDKELDGTMSSFCISPSGMNVSIGFDNGKTIIFNNLLGDSLGKFTLFSDGSAVEYIDFLDDEIMLGATKEKIVLISLLKKGAISRIMSDVEIKNIYSQKEKLVYVTAFNEIYFVDLKDIKTPNKFLLEKLASSVVDIKFCNTKNGIFVTTLDSLYFIDIKTKKVTLLKDGFSGIVSMLVDNNDAIYIANDTKVEFISNIFNSENEKVDDLEEKSLEIPKVDTKVRFLTVDDSTTIRLVIRKSILNNFEDVEVAEAVDGVEAMSYLAKNPNIDIIFLDWNMPNMNGDQVVEEISKNPALKHIKIIMATTEGGKDRVKQMISKGVIGYLVKPLKAGSVNPLAQKMIEMVRNERETDV